MKINLQKVQERKEELEKEFEIILENAVITKGKVPKDRLKWIKLSDRGSKYLIDGWMVKIKEELGNACFHLREKPSEEFVRVMVLQSLKKGEYNLLDALERYYMISPVQIEELKEDGFIS